MINSRGLSQKVLVVDDDGDLRKIVMDALMVEGFMPLGAEDGFSAIAMVKKESPDAVILDLNMPGINGIETLKEIKRVSSYLPVIMLTGFGDIPVAVTAMQLGAYDFLIKPPDYSNLVAKLRVAIEMSSNGGLSTRERETIAWVKEGKTNIEIASLMGLSENTVRTYLKRIFGKLGVRSRTQAVISALEKAYFSTSDC